MENPQLKTTSVALTVLGKSVHNDKPHYDVEYNGRTYQVTLYNFQRKLPLPDTLQCYVKTYADGQVTISQDYATLLSQLYTVGEEYDFVVRADYTEKGYYEVIDENEFYFRLTNYAGVRLFTQQRVRCRVTDLLGIKVSLELVDEDEDVQTSDETTEFGYKYIAAEMLEDLAKTPTWDVEGLAQLLFVNEHPYDYFVNRWVRHTIKDSGLDISQELIDMLDEIRQQVLYVLQSSEMLNSRAYQERRVFQARLTTMAETLDCYILAATNLLQANEQNFFDEIMGNLQTSGYVYHPHEQFERLMCIFTLRKELMEQQMTKLFRIVHAKEASYWKNDPFRKALIRLLELYISEKREHIDVASPSDTADVRRVIEALSMQILLADKEEDSRLYDWGLKRAMLYRYCSFLRTSQTSNAIEKAFRNLMDSENMLEKEYSWSDTSQVELLASRITNNLNPTPDVAADKFFFTDSAMLRIRGGEVVLQDAQNKASRSALPKALLPWHNLAVMSDNTVKTMPKTGKIKLDRYKTMWTEIERFLFEVPEQKTIEKKNKEVPEVGKTVNVRVIYYDKMNHRYRVRIEDDYYGGDGYVVDNEMAGYENRCGQEAFLSENGLPLLLPAKVIGHNATDECFFSIKPLIYEFVIDNTQYTDECKCVVTLNDGQYIAGITEDGVSVSLRNIEDFDDVLPGEFLLVTGFERGKSGFVSVIGKERTTGAFGAGQCFKNLIDWYAIDEYQPDDSDATEAVQLDNALEADRVAEFMHIVDRVATLEPDYTVRYNYVAFARILSLMLGDTARESYYSGWMKLIELLDNFAVNNKVDVDAMQAFETKHSGLFLTENDNSQLFSALKIIACKGVLDKQEQLLQFQQEFAGTENETLASLVLSYNLLLATGVHQAIEKVDEEIGVLLDVSRFRSNLTDFGNDEGLTKEYKTSLVYPAGQKYHMQPNLDLQTEEIMQGICAFLNKDGGTLYIGVNNHGMGIGMENDLSYRQFSTGKAGTEPRDLYDLYVHNMIRSKFFSPDIEAYITTRFLPEEENAGHLIYEIKVEPYYVQAVALKTTGVYYERLGSSTLARYGEFVAPFIDRRNEEIVKHRIAIRQMNEAAEPAAPAQPVATTSVESKVEKLAPTESVIFDTDRIATSQIRNNVLMDYEDGYIQACAYILFLPGGKYKVVDSYYGEDCLLALNVHADELQKYLVIAYASGNVFKVPMDVVLERERHQEFRLNADDKIAFATIADNDAAIMSIIRDRKGKEVVRFDSVKNMPEEQNLQATGSAIVTIDVDAFLQFDVIGKKQKSSFTAVLDRPKTTLGQSVSQSSNRQLYDKIKKLGIILAFD